MDEQGDSGNRGTRREGGRRTRWSAETITTITFGRAGWRTLTSDRERENTGKGLRADNDNDGNEGNSK